MKSRSCAGLAAKGLLTFSSPFALCSFNFALCFMLLLFEAGRIRSVLFM